MRRQTSSNSADLAVKTDARSEGLFPHSIPNTKGEAMMNKQAWRVTTVLLAVGALSLLMACSKKPTEESTAGGGTTTSAVDKSQAGGVSGTVKYTGAKPAAKKIDMAQDPVCAKKGENTSDTWVGNGDALGNVYVFIDNPPAGAGEPPKDKVTIDQEGCRYHPHVLAMMTNQPLEIKNSDPTTHNIHPTPDPDSGNREWNESQGPSAAPLEKTFSRPEVMLPVKCNQHPWMKMYINVAKSPYFAVTGPDGKYEIKDLPPGTYTLVAVHEVGGKKTQSITVAPKQTANADFTFGGGGAAGGSK
jgi:hypothetical protein